MDTDVDEVRLVVGGVALARLKQIPAFLPDADGAGDEAPEAQQKLVLGPRLELRQSIVVRRRRCLDEKS